jgi:Protein of unknown function (DUF3830)
MRRIQISAGPFEFEAKVESADAPATCAWFEQQLPFTSSVIHARWSGEAVWVPLGGLESGLPQENHTVHPSRGDVLFYPGGISETEILLVYGSASFASKMGSLAGNHFLTIVGGNDQLVDFGEAVLWKGALDIAFTAVDR